MNTTTYKQAEDIVKTMGFKYEMGTPLHGCRFKNNVAYAIILRMGDNDYSISYYN